MLYNKASRKNRPAQVYVCKEQRVSKNCFKRTAPPRKGEVKFEKLGQNELYYASAECQTNAGAGPRTTWISIETSEESVGPGRTKPPTRTLEGDTDVDVTIAAVYGMNVQLSWTLSMRNGSIFKNSYIRSLQIRRYKKGDSGYSVSDSLLITEDRTLRQMDLGLSPGFKFDINCYFFTITVELKNNKEVRESTEEKCFNFVSPSYLMLYAFLFAALLLMTGIIYRATSARRKPVLTETSAATSTSVTRTSASTTKKAKRSKTNASSKSGLRGKKRGR